IAEPLTAKPAQTPEERRQQAENDDEANDQFDRYGPIAEQGVHHSSLRPRGLACPSEFSEWLTPAAILAALNTNKELRKMVPPIVPALFQSFVLVNGGLMAGSCP